MCKTRAKTRQDRPVTAIAVGPSHDYTAAGTRVKGPRRLPGDRILRSGRPSGQVDAAPNSSNELTRLRPRHLER